MEKRAQGRRALRHRQVGYMSSRHVPLTASDREQVVTLHPELVITGRVTDAETGRPLPKFRLIRGQTYERAARRPTGPRTRRWKSRAVDTRPGSTSRAEAFFVRVEAPGYQPADSRAFRSTEGSQTFDFALRRGEEQLSGVVLLPDGKPAAGAEVVLDTRTMGCLMQAGQFDRRANVPTSHGRPRRPVHVHPPGDPFLLIAVSDAGYADASPDEFAKSGKLVLQPWGKIEGEVRIGRQPAPNQQVEFQPALFQRGGRTYVFTYGYTTLTDQRGRFAFDRVVPGPGTVSRVVTNAAAPPGFPRGAGRSPSRSSPARRPGCGSAARAGR